MRISMNGAIGIRISKHGAEQCSEVAAASSAYYGKLIGKLSELEHGVSGEVYAVDARTLFIKDFTYDGEGPAAWFYAGHSKSVGTNGFKVRDERGTFDLLRRYRKKDITLMLPEGKTLANIKWFSVYCDDYAVNFGDVKIPRNFDYPRPQKLGQLSGIHGVSSEPVVIVDAQTLLIPSFTYDGEAPDAKFWVGAGLSPTPQGIKLPNENGEVGPLRRYDHKTIVLSLPDDLTVHQIGHFGVWCEAFAVDFGHVKIPHSLNVPPSLKMLGVSPQSKLNCEVLDDRLSFEVRWAVAGDSIVVQLVGKLADNEYMSFGLSGDQQRSVMVGGDIVVAWVDKRTIQGYAIDYYLDAKSQCSGGRGSCPDVKIQENTNSVRMLNAAIVNGFSIVTYQRPLKASDELDRQIFTNGSQAVIWAIGPLNDKQEVSFHSNYLKGNQFIDFGRPPSWNCPLPELQEQQSNNNAKPKSSDLQQLTPTTVRPSRFPATPAPAPTDNAWEIPPIQCFEPEDGVFYAQMGPTGGKHGYPAITGHVGWGISWYINGLLIPEIHVVRNKTYTFVVEGGDNPSNPARYHPFYITDDPVGGYQHKTPEEKANVSVYAGVVTHRGTIRPTGVGRLCQWTPDQNQPLADAFNSFGAYQRTLTLVCDSGEPGFVTWTPDENTPDTVYYHCYTHRYLGWKIHVHDSCESLDRASAAASEQHEVFAEPDRSRAAAADLDTEASVHGAPSKVTAPAQASPADYARFAGLEQDYPGLGRDYALRGHHLLAPYHHNIHRSNPASKLVAGPYKHHHLHHYQPQLQLQHHSHPSSFLDAFYYYMGGNSLNNNNHNNYHHMHHNHHLHHHHPQLTINADKLQRRSPLKYLAVKYVMANSPASDPRNQLLHHHAPHHHHQLHQHQLYQHVFHQSEQPPQPPAPPSSAAPEMIINAETATEPASQQQQLAVGKSPELTSESYISARPAPAASSQNLVVTKSQTPMLRQQPATAPQFILMSKKRQYPIYFQPSMKRPMLAPIALPSMPYIPKPAVAYERKKAVYKSPVPVVSRMQTLSKPKIYYKPTKLVKVEIPAAVPALVPQKMKIEIKDEGLTGELKRPLVIPTKNMGFDPSSIVIERGFKPIFKKLPTAELHEQNKRPELMFRDETPSASEQIGETLGPVYVPPSAEKSVDKKETKKKSKSMGKSDDGEQIFAREPFLPTLATFAKSSYGDKSLTTERSSQESASRPKRDAQNDHSHQHREDHDHGQSESKEQQSQPSSTAEIIIANIEYIALTVILYFAL
ncbi:protein Skeletor, isoforms B/C [Trichogramma pretiosum]|uniref:protein Skeletor, isoforms B/C n=1 Tax=Trichogramma pretiosum TaxID=7493 RepID=UPI0006C950F9|nr:protein Skeletor, isoforms B/C [Trichogramma pretiosum]